MQFCIVGVGELVWDLFPDGKRLGGAPSNFTYHAQQLGADAVVCFVASCIGNDALGKTLCKCLEQLHLQRSYVYIDPRHDTGTVTVSFNAAGMPGYTINEQAAWDYIPPLPKALALACHAVCFGSLARCPVSRQNILAFLENMPRSALRIFDINLRQHYYTKDIIIASLQQANILKINDEELAVLAPILAVSGSVQAIVRQLRRQYSLRLVILTRAAKGSLLVTERETAEHPGFSITLLDSVGAGDAFTAAAVIGLLQDIELQTLNEYANRVASFVCTKPGATPVLTKELTSLFA